MPTSQDQSEQIERFLAGEMPESERINFEAALLRDPALAEALALQKSLQHSLGNLQRRRLLDALAEVVEQEEKKRPGPIIRWLSPGRLAAAAAAVLILVAAVGAWLYFQPAIEQHAVVEQPAPQPQSPPDSIRTITPAAPTIEQKPQPAPIAAADRRDFGPNQALDPLAGTLVRGSGADISVTKPENDAVVPLRNGKANFALAGKAGELTGLTLRIYNNRAADFAAGKPVYQFEIDLDKHTFSWKKTLELNPGRYYAVLSAPGEEEPAVVLRFYAGSR